MWMVNNGEQEGGFSLQHFEDSLLSMHTYREISSPASIHVEHLPDLELVTRGSLLARPRT
jgi:hypothetical protein